MVSNGHAPANAVAPAQRRISIRARAVGRDTTAGKIVSLIDSAPVGDTRMQNHAERLADRFVVPALTLATGSALLTGDFDRFLSLVIVDFGSGIRVAAPTAMLSTMTRAARRGIIIKSGRHMERLAEVDTIVFDKTGTLTRGTPEVIDIVSYQSRLDARALIGLAAAAESRLQHSVAEALRLRAAQIGAPAPLCDEPNYSVGIGVEALVDDHFVHVGNQRFMRKLGIAIDRAATAGNKTRGRRRARAPTGPPPSRLRRAADNSTRNRGWWK